MSRKFFVGGNWKCVNLFFSPFLSSSLDFLPPPINCKLTRCMIVGSLIHRRMERRKMWRKSWQFWTKPMFPPMKSWVNIIFIPLICFFFHNLVGCLVQRWWLVHHSCSWAWLKAYSDRTSKLQLKIAGLEKEARLLVKSGNFLSLFFTFLSCFDG